MTYRVVLHPLLDADADEAIDWYESRQPGLGDRFDSDFHACAEKVANRPATFQIVYKQFRQAMLNHFPYVVVFELEDNIVWVAGLFHCSRNRAVWDTRI